MQAFINRGGQVVFLPPQAPGDTTFLGARWRDWTEEKTEIPVARAHERFDAEGRLLDSEVFEQLRLHLTTLASEAVAVPERVAA